MTGKIWHGVLLVVAILFVIAAFLLTWFVPIDSWFWQHAPTGEITCWDPRP